MIELLVVMGVMTIISAVVLANNSQFGGTITLRNLAYDIALSIRQAQTYGTSVRRFTQAGESDFQVAYGIRFDITTPTTYIVFADGIEKDGAYDIGEEVETDQIGRGYGVIDLCIDNDTNCSVQELDITFLRPNPDARIRANESETLHEKAYIVLGSPRGDRITLVVESTGQIAVTTD